MHLARSFGSLKCCQRQPLRKRQFVSSHTTIRLPIGYWIGASWTQRTTPYPSLTSFPKQLRLCFCRDGRTQLDYITYVVDCVESSRDRQTQPGLLRRQCRLVYRVCVERFSSVFGWAVKVITRVARGQARKAEISNSHGRLDRFGDSNFAAIETKHMCM